MSFDFITVVHVEGRDVDCVFAQYAIKESMIQLPGSKGLLLSPRRPSKLLDDIEFIKIPPLGYQEYSFFMVYGLHQYIQTEYALTVQEDGWVIDGDNWKDEFLKYDYIGAPTHLGRVSLEDKREIHTLFQWTQFLNNADASVEVVFNGGFSLRSKKFLEAPARYGMPYTITAPSGPGNGQRIFNWRDECDKEDVRICLYMRPSLEKIGMKFAPLELARYFSFEHLTPVLHDDISINDVLGHHASMRRMKHNRVIHYTEPFSFVRSIYGEDRVISLLNKHRYTFSFKHD